MESRKKAADTAKIGPKTDTSKFYELGYLLVPSLSLEEAKIQVATLEKLFTDKGGELISAEGPVSIDLSYDMVKVIHAHREKCAEAYFGWMKFEIETEAIGAITKALDESEKLLRYLLIKTVRENTLVKGTMNLGREEKKKALDEDVVDEAPVPEINEEELDKSIDDLVIA